jgi:hypothetical protein
VKHTYISIKGKRRLFLRMYIHGVEKRNMYRLLVGNPQGKRPVGRPRRRWMDNIKMDLFRDRIECCGLEWFGSG